MIIENNILSTLWIQGELDDLTKLCLQSWINLGYKVNLYTYEIEKMESTHDNIVIKNANEISNRLLTEE